MKRTLTTPAWVLVIQLVCCGASAKVCDETRCTVCESDICLECLYGYWGSQCQHTCISCWSGGCQQHTGRCHQCLPGRHTENCATLCPSTCRVSYDKNRYCDRTSGKCLEGCAVGWWGSTCNMTCGQGCRKMACYQEDGVCISDCKEGLHGHKCDKHNCLNGHMSDRCTRGCKDGWAGVVCSERCGADCKKCHQYSSTSCVICKAGLYGPDCQSECSANCVNTTCSMTGQCENGCRRGFHGNKCEETCPYRCLDCDQTSGNCRTCEIGWTGLQCLDQPVSYTTYQPNIPDLTNGCNPMAEVKFAMVLAIHQMSNVLKL